MSETKQRRKAAPHYLDEFGILGEINKRREALLDQMQPGSLELSSNRAAFLELWTRHEELRKLANWIRKKIR